MAIEAKDINLNKFLETFTPQFLSEPGKVVIDNALFLQIASLLKIDLQIQRLVSK